MSLVKLLCRFAAPLAATAAGLVAACGREDGPPLEDGGIAPLKQPNDETDLNESKGCNNDGSCTPRQINQNNLDRCAPPSSSISIEWMAGNSCSRMVINRDPKFDETIGGWTTFVTSGLWNSPPPGYAERARQGDEDALLAAAGVGYRSMGDSLSIFGLEEGKIPNGFEEKGLKALVYGAFTVGCSFRLAFVTMPLDKFNTVKPLVPSAKAIADESFLLATYSDKECLATLDFSNESIDVYEAPFCEFKTQPDGKTDTIANCSGTLEARVVIGDELPIPPPDPDETKPSETPPPEDESPQEEPASSTDETIPELEPPDEGDTDPDGGTED